MTALSAAAAAPLQGRWAGEQLQLVLNASGGRLELDCASGTINAPVNASSDGKFSATGTFEQHKPGPQAAGAAAKPAAARFSGAIEEGLMTLSIWPEGATVPEVFKLRAGAAVKLHRCL
jgi:hypothetical protein